MSLRSNCFAKKDKQLVTHMFLLVLVAVLTVGNSQALELTPATYLFDIKHDFSQASDVAVASEGSIYVVDGVNQCIKVFDSAGTFLFSFGEAGNGPGQFSYPLGMDIDDGGRLYVADSGNQRLQILTAKGDYINEIKVEIQNGQESDPTDVSVDRQGRMAYVVDNGNHCVLKYDLETLGLLDVYGKPGIEKMEFRYPFLISKFNDKYLYIVDVINTRVQEITSDGRFVRIIGAWGVEKGQFFRPKGVAVDSDGRVYVSDSYMGVIQVFEEGVFRSAIGTKRKNKLLRFDSPVGLCIDQKNRLYVVEMFAERVSVFQL